MYFCNEKDKRPNDKLQKKQSPCKETLDHPERYEAELSRWGNAVPQAVTSALPVPTAPSAKQCCHSSHQTRNGLRSWPLGWLQGPSHSWDAVGVTSCDSPAWPCSFSTPLSHQGRKLELACREVGPQGAGTGPQPQAGRTNDHG